MSSILLEDKGISAEQRDYQIPWSRTAYVYNMINNPPEKTINVTQGDWKAAIGDPEKVSLLYIMTDLLEEDYEIIRRMVNLRALYIYTAQNLKDLSFISNLVSLQELMIHKSCVEDIAPLAKLRSKQKMISPWNLLKQVAILRSEISDLSPLKEDTYYSEFWLIESKVPEEDEIYRKLMGWRTR